MKLTTKDTGERPAGKAGFCFYCRSKIGLHTPDCVIPCRSVVLKMEITYVAEVPLHWTKENIEFHRNDGTGCVQNDLRAMVLSDGYTGPCGCAQKTISFVREATVEDHQDSLSIIGKEYSIDMECK